MFADKNNDSVYLTTEIDSTVEKGQAKLIPRLTEEIKHFSQT